MAAFNLRTFLNFAICIGVFFAVQVSFSQDLSSKQLTSSEDSSPVKVLQNRFFQKTWRPELGLLAGSMLSESFTDTKMVGARLSLFISEWIGFEVQKINTQVSPSDSLKSLRKQRYRSESNPDNFVYADVPLNKIQSITDFSVLYAPFYGKLNLLDKFIVYSDLYFLAGMSSIETDQGKKNAITLGFGQRYYVGKSFSIRLDLRNRNYDESRDDVTVKKKTLSLDFGFGYFFF